MLDLGDSYTSFTTYLDHSKIVHMSEVLKNLPIDISRLISQVCEILHMPAAADSSKLAMKKILKFSCSDTQRAEHILKYMQKNKLTLNDFKNVSSPENDYVAWFLIDNADLSFFDCNIIMPIAVRYRPDVAHLILNRHGRDLEQYVPFFQNSRDFVLGVVQNCGIALMNAKAAFRDDKEIVLAAVQNMGFSIHFASIAMRNDKDVMLAAAQHYGFALKFASDALRDDKDVVLAAVQCSGLALEHASFTLRDDKEVVLAAVQNCALAINYASVALQKDQDVIDASKFRQ